MKKEAKGVRAVGKKGISATTVIVPAIIVILILHAMIIINTLRINDIGQKISEITQDNIRLPQVLKQFERSADNLTDEAVLYSGSGDTEYLDSYITQLGTQTQLQNTLETIFPYDEESQAYEQMRLAMRVFQARKEYDLKALRLCAEGYGTNLSAYPQVAKAELTAEETALSREEKKSAGQAILVSGEYYQYKQQIRSCVDRTIQIASGEANANIGAQSAILGRYRALQWVMTLVIIFIFCVMCVLLLALLVIPLKKSANRVQKGETIPEDKGLAELRDLAGTYNELLRRRDQLENDLRDQSQTDALTHLPNRMAFQDYLSSMSHANRHCSLTVFSMDVNVLKEINDTKGHIYGDALLRDVSECILSAFGDESGKNCFRFGGDEFAAFWIDAPEEKIAPALKKFREEQAARRISVSVGYAFADDLSKTTVQQLFEQADKRMYEEKARLKAAGEA